MPIALADLDLKDKVDGDALELYPIGFGKTAGPAGPRNQKSETPLGPHAFGVRRP